MNFEFISTILSAVFGVQQSIPVGWQCLRLVELIKT